MKIDVYTSALNGKKHLSVLKGTKIKELDLPSDIDKDMLELSPFRTRLDIDTTKEHDAIDYKDVLEQIEKNGFAVHGAKFQIALS